MAAFTSCLVFLKLSNIKITTVSQNPNCMWCDNLVGFQNQVTYMQCYLCMCDTTIWLAFHHIKLQCYKVIYHFTSIEAELDRSTCLGPMGSLVTWVIKSNHRKQTQSYWLIIFLLSDHCLAFYEHDTKMCQLQHICLLYNSLVISGLMVTILWGY